MNKKLIIGDGNDASAVERITLINTDDYTATSETDESKTVIGNGALVVDYEGLSEGSFAPKFVTLSSGAHVVDTQANVFYCDATSGNITIDLLHNKALRFFIRVDATANTVTITPNSGNINGAANKGLNVQFEKISVLSDSTNFYY